MSEKRIRAYRHGLFAGTAAALLFRLKGHRILARRYRTPVGEIDLVALRGRRLAFVEVKQRRSLDDAGWLGVADARVAPHRQSRTILALKSSRLLRSRYRL